MDIGSRIKMLRENKGLTQQELANAMNISVGAISMYETGQRIPRKNVIEKLADYFNVDMNYLYGYEAISAYLLPPEVGMALKSLSERPVMINAIRELSQCSDDEIIKMLQILKMLKA